MQAWTSVVLADGHWHVFVRRDGKVSMPPAIPRGGYRLTLDVGPGPDGRPALAYVACTNVCRVVVSDLDGAHPQTVPGSEGASAVTIWRSRVVWVRGARTVLTRRLGSGGVTRLSTTRPQRVCDFATGERRRCVPSESIYVDDVELHGSQLALIDSGDQTDVRLQSVHSRRQRLVALMGVGEGQETWIGPAWAHNRLFFHRSCPFACPKIEGFYSFDPNRHTYGFAANSFSISGFAMDADARSAFEIIGLFGGRDAEAAPDTTTLSLTEPLTFTPVRPPISS